MAPTPCQDGGQEAVSCSEGAAPAHAAVEDPREAEMAPDGGPRWDPTDFTHWPWKAGEGLGR